MTYNDLVVHVCNSSHLHQGWVQRMLTFYFSCCALLCGDLGTTYAADELLGALNACTLLSRPHCSFAAPLQVGDEFGELIVGGTAAAGAAVKSVLPQQVLFTQQLVLLKLTLPT